MMNAPAMTGAAGASGLRDTLRQTLNVVFALAQIGATLLLYATRTDGTFDSQSASSVTPIVPAGYAFAIWTLIYGGALAYAVYQALPRQRENSLLRRIGFSTASAYLGTTVWLFTAERQWVWITVAVFFWILASLLDALVAIIRAQAPRSAAERFLVVLPVSVYAGWATVATIADVSTALTASGVNNPLFPNAVWAVAMLLIGGAIASFTTLVSRGNVWYAGAVIWALLAVAVANVAREPDAPVAIAAGVMAVVVALALLWGRRATSSPA